jgi:macrolide-specific efflux system membrane fusion protein
VRRRPRKWWVLGAVFLVLAAAGAATTWFMTRSPVAAVPTLVAATRGPIRQSITASGTIEPAHQANLSFAVGGTVTAVHAKVGQRVAKGTTLATVDTASLVASVGSAQAAADAAQQQLSTVESAASSPLQIASAKAELAAARSNLAAMQQSLADAALVSPIAGVVAAVDVSVGDRISGGVSNSTAGNSNAGSIAGGSGGGTSAAASSTSAGASNAQIVVVGMDGWVVDAAVASADLAQMKPGLQAEITPTDAPTKVFGTVSSVGIVASSSGSGSATFPITVGVTGNPAGLFAGGTATVAIIVKQLVDVLTVPTIAVHSSGGSTVVYQMKNGHQVSTPVTIGTVFGPTTQIVSGIEAGDQVVIPSFRPGGGGTQRARTGQGGGFGQGGFGQGGGFGNGGSGNGGNARGGNG